jgi:hypothetical protein
VVLGEESAVNEAELAAAGERLARVLDGTAAMTSPSVSPKGGTVLGEEARRLISQALNDFNRFSEGPTDATAGVVAALDPTVRALVAQARADGAAEERERIARRFDSVDGDGWGSLAPVITGLFEQVARIVRGTS